MNRVTDRGFTLLEVLIALAVVAIALLALSRAVATQVDTLAELEERTYALWVADNVLTRVRMDPAWRAPGRYAGREVMGPVEWTWALLIRPSPDPAVPKSEPPVSACKAVWPHVRSGRISLKLREPMDLVRRAG